MAMETEGADEWIIPQTHEWRTGDALCLNTKGRNSRGRAGASKPGKFTLSANPEPPSPLHEVLPPETWEGRTGGNQHWSLPRRLGAKLSSGDSYDLRPRTSVALHVGPGHLFCDVRVAPDCQTHSLSGEFTFTMPGSGVHCPRRPWLPPPLCCDLGVCDGQL